MKDVKKKVLLIMMVISIIAVFFTGCSDTPSVDQKQQLAQENAFSEAQKQVGMPNIKNFKELKDMKAILEARDDADLITYAYVFNKKTGKYVFLYKCMGYGLPYATQYTNPKKIAKGYTSTVIPQADPDGLYSPASAAGTWLMYIDEKGQTKVGYFEQEIEVLSTKLRAGLVDPDSIKGVNY